MNETKLKLQLAAIEARLAALEAGAPERAAKKPEQPKAPAVPRRKGAKDG